jgi:hypothetical protein
MIFNVGADDRITVRNWYTNTAYSALERVTFADGAVWDTPALQAIVPVAFAGTDAGETITGWDGVDIIDGADGNDKLNGFAGSDTLNGGAGDDIIVAGEGNDTVTGADGNDTIDGGAGDDLLEGGAGDDIVSDLSGANTLRGGAGSDTLAGKGTFSGGVGDDVLTGSQFNSGDTYLYELGDGADTIADAGYSEFADQLVFGAGITPVAVSLLRVGDDLRLEVGQGEDEGSVTIRNWFAGTDYNAIEFIKFADGTVWDVPVINEFFGQQGLVGSSALSAAQEMFDGGSGTLSAAQPAPPGDPAHSAVDSWTLLEALSQFHGSGRQLLAAGALGGEDHLALDEVLWSGGAPQPADRARAAHSQRRAAIGLDVNLA